MSLDGWTTGDRTNEDFGGQAFQMKFKIRCEAIKEFDPATKSYVKCNSEIEVDDSQVGTLAACPHCGNDVEVLAPSLVGPSSKSGKQAGNDSKPAPSDSRPKTSNSRPKATFSPVESGQGSSESTRKPNKSTASSTPKRESTPTKTQVVTAERPSSDLSPIPSSTTNPGAMNPGAMNPGSGLVSQSGSANTETGGSVLRQTNFSRANSCQKCGTPLEEKQPTCPNCGTRRNAAFIEKKDRRPYQRKGPYGFQLWLYSITKPAGNPHDTNWFGIVLTIFMLLITGAGIALIIFGPLTQKIAGVFFVMIATAIFFCRAFYRKLDKDPKTPIPAWGQVIWAVVLFFMRLFKFSKYNESQFLDRKGDEDFTDRELAADQNLSKKRAIDLDGTSITDQGLLYLHDLRGIQFLIVRNTEVSVEAVQNLQQTIPKTWIWY